jgi:excisionase family DNA binding protein
VSPLKQPESVVPFRPRGGREPWLAGKQLADYYGVSTRTIQRWTQQGMPAMRIGGTVRYQVSRTDAWASEAS